MNLIDCCIDHKIDRVVALSTDKASNPINLYGATKLVADKLFVASNAGGSMEATKFSVVRYGNVMGSRGSVIPFFRSRSSLGVLPITDRRMTRFMITLEQAVELVWHALQDMHGGEIYVKKIPSMAITDIAKAIAPDAQQHVIGVRPGEKLHEQLIGVEDAPHCYEYRHHYKVLPAIHNWSMDPVRINGGTKVPDGFTYTSDNNPHWMAIDQLQKWMGEFYAAPPNIA